MKKGRIYAVHYGEKADVSKDFVVSLLPLLSEKLDLVLINNSAIGLLDALSEKYVTILDTGKNLGYFGGIRYGMEKCPLEDRNYAIVCNNDIRILQSDFVQRLEAKLEVWDVIAPSTRTLNDIEQNPHRGGKPTKLRKIYYKLYYTGYGMAWIINTLYELRKRLTKSVLPESQEGTIYSPHGAFMVLSSTYFNKGGIIDDGYFLYGEEDSIGAMAERLEMRVGFVPSLKIQHLESISTGKSLSPQKYAFQKAAYQYILKKYNF